MEECRIVCAIAANPFDLSTVEILRFDQTDP